MVNTLRSEHLPDVESATQEARRTGNKPTFSKMQSNGSLSYSSGSADALHIVSMCQKAPVVHGHVKTKSLTALSE